MSALSIRIIGLFIVEKRDPRPQKAEPGPWEAPGLSEASRSPQGRPDGVGQPKPNYRHAPSPSLRGCQIRMPSQKRSDLVVLMRVFVCRYENILYALGVTFPVVRCGRRNGWMLEVGQMLQTFTTSR